MPHRRMILGLALIASVAILAACVGQSGPQGPVGPAGPTGPQGPAGPPGEAASLRSEYVGSETCKDCHTEIYDAFKLSGHAFKLNPVVDGQPPEYPFTEVPNPPEGYTWDDISYVIGGYNWKARFIDLEGYIITGDADATTQYNLYNEHLGLGDNWVAYSAGEENKPYNCGTCHTTGYNPEGNQDDLPGLVGTWSEPGIACEACHGPGSLHAADPYGFSVQVERDGELCGQCHRRGDVEAVDASGGFIKHHEQYEELFQSKHLVLDCVDCHDPHVGVVQLRQTDQPTTRTTCENCHFQQVDNQAVEVHRSNYPACIDCHMPRITKSALGDAERFSGDIRTHVMAIDPTQVGQFTEDGSTSLSQISLDFACRGCHNGVDGSDQDQETLIEFATGYHSP